MQTLININIKKNTIMKTILQILFIQSAAFSFPQNTTPIQKILQEEVNKELKNQFKSDFFEGDTLVVVQNFSINKENVLSLELKHRFYYGGGYQIEKQEVALNQITGIAKDVQILFEAKEDAVKITRTNYYDDGRIETVTKQGDLFFTNLKHEKGNEGFAYTMQKLFKKASYTIEISRWYD